MLEAPAERAPLRAADWRFLLPHPDGGRFGRLVLLGGPPGLAKRVVDIGVADVVTSELPAARSADAVVAFHDSRWTYRELADCLVPGGALYCEIDRRALRHWMSTPRRVGASLQKVGLSLTGTYVVGPSLYRPRVYVPLDAPGALRWYLETLYNPWKPSVALVRKALRVAASAPRPFVALAPHLAVTAVAASGPRTAPGILGLPVLPAELERQPLHPLLLSGSHHETLSQRVVILPFAADSTQPLAVVKVAKLSSLNVTLEAEQKTMAEVRARLDPSMRVTIPRPLRVERWEGVTVATESFSPGESLQRRACRWGRPIADKLEDLRLAAAWLAEFHRQTEVSRDPWSATTRSELVDGPVERYGAAFGVTEREAFLFGETRRYGDMLAGTPLPIVLRKPDFFGSNVIRSGRALSVVDWESPHAGPALCDLLRFVAPWGDGVSRVPADRHQESFRTLVFAERRDAVSKAVDDAIAGYLEHLSMDGRLRPVLVVYTWVDRALHHFEKQKRHGERPSDSRAGNRHVDRVTVLAEHAEQLFGSSRHGAPLGTSA